MMLGIGVVSPKIALARAAKSGIFNLPETYGRGGQMRATGRVRFNTVTSSPCATSASTALKS